jgi:hypothetical protein
MYFAVYKNRGKPCKAACEQLRVLMNNFGLLSAKA